MSKTSGNRERNSIPQFRRSERFHIDLRVPFAFCTAEAAVLILLCTAICYFSGERTNALTSSAVCLFVLAFYVLSAGGIFLFYSIKYVRVKKAEEEARLIDTEIYDMFRYVIDMPYTVIDSDGKIKIMNGALQDILGYRNAVCGIDFSEICPVPINALSARALNRDAYLSEPLLDLPEKTPLPEMPIVRLADGKRYEINCYIMKIKGENFYFTVFKDINEFLEAKEKNDRESPVVAYIMLDNLQELTQYVRADYRAASTEIENILNAWIKEMHGFIREYDRDRYLVIFSKEELDKQMINDFPIQQSIMDLRIGDNSFPVTISMGIAHINGTFEEKEKAAAAALDIAIQRGGNQVAVKRQDSNGFVFFGGTHKTMENNTSVISRISAEILEEKISGASNVLIMGHANPDFDSIGSCVGAARLALAVIEEKYAGTQIRPSVNIVVDKSCETFEICAKQLSALKIYDEIFIGKESASDLVTPSTVLIITDVNNQYIYESPDLSKTISNIAVIDHHRLVSALAFNTFLQYVETTKSSASEIISEILEQSKYASSLHKEEAEVLLSGIMLDTNNFTRNSGSQTFAITHYLYSRGAHTEVVREFFNENIEELRVTSDFESRAQLYRDNIAIACMSRDHIPSPDDRIIASKVANKLLNIRGVEATFTLVRIDNDISISGRSKGKINVQLILERLKGGGHFDMAGAQMKNASMSQAYELLKDAIDDYYEYDYKKPHA